MQQGIVERVWGGASLIPLPPFRSLGLGFGSASLSYFISTRTRVSLLFLTAIHNAGMPAADEGIVDIKAHSVKLEGEPKVLQTVGDVLQ
jgi:hypothetical protein